jgi:carbon monoxide dehydrogenase subunit G
MRISTVFDVAVPRDRVVAYLSEPRHLIAANHKGPVLQRSEGPLGTGSWFVLGFDQLRARIEYTTFEPPTSIAVTVAMTGIGSGGATSQHEFRLSELDGGSATRIEESAEGDGGWLRWAPLQRAAQNMTWRRMRKQIEATA